MYIDLSLSQVPGRARARLGRSALLLILGLALVLGAHGAWAYETAKTPAKAVPEARWGALRPGGILGDSTKFAFQRDPDRNEPFWFGVDIENGWLFAVTGRGFQIYDTNSNPDSPPRTAYGYGPDLMPVFYHSDEDWFLEDVDAPPGIDTMAAVAGWGQGFMVWNTSDKSSPTVHYQDEGVQSFSVYSAILGGTPYAFAAGGDGVYYYDLNAAKTKAKCLDTSPTTLPCSGVYKGKAIAGSPTLSGGAIHGVGNFLAVAKIGSGGFEIWNISTLPSSPAVKVMSGSQAARGVAMWQDGSSYYLAVGNLGQLYLYDVSCIAGGSCAAPTPLKVLDVPNGIPALSRVTVSRTGAGVPYLYMGSFELTCKPQAEYLFDVSNPANPVDITPKVHPDGYWGWYYEPCATGFNWVYPQMGRFYGNNFYRAAYGILDVHKLALALPPTANFTWSPQTDIYPGTQVQFTDQSTGNPAPDSWDWTFTSDASAPSSSLQNPLVSFTDVGPHQITMRSRNAQGWSAPTPPKTLTVLDPVPKITAVTVSPPNPVICQPITFTATGVTGKPTLTFSWDIPGASPAPSPTNANPLVWNTTADSTPGPYTATVTVNNSFGPPASKSATFTLGGLAPLPGNGTFTPTCTNCTNGSPPAGVAQLSVNIPGATAWNWDCGSGPEGYVTDPVTGPVHSCNYTTKGVKAIKVSIKNCVEGEKASAILNVTINEITPLTALFSVNALCGGGFCFVNAGSPVSFTDQSTGAELWDYDWDGVNGYEDSNNTAPRASHTFATQGSFTPVLRVRRGASEEATFTLPFTLVVSAPTPGNITISGPSSGQPNQALAFSASGGGSCSPSANGWSWSATGGTVTGGNAADVTISWSGTGSKTITATNSACGVVSGSKSVQISSDPPPPPPPPPPPAGLKAEFTFSPSAPNVNQAVSFNGASSTGSPTSYAWDFGDGSPIVTGAQVTHTFATPGNKQVQLTVTGTGSCPPAPFCAASTTKTVVVGSGEQPLIPAFTTSATCIDSLGFVLCSAEAGQTVTFQDQSQGGPTTWSWNFGDGGTATGASVSHVFAAGGSFTVALTVGRGSTTATTSKPFNIADRPAAKTRSIVLPWIAQTRGALLQSSDLYVHNPGTTPMNVTLEFRKRGVPESNPPKATKTIQPGATFYAGDVLKELFNKENVAGFISLTVDEGVAPVITSFNTTFDNDGKEFGQTVGGVPMASGASAAEDKLQNLVGLISNSERLAYFGISNPSDAPATYKLRFFDKTGRQIGSDSQDFIVSRFGQRQFQSKEISDDFGVSNADDYRVEIETKTGGGLVPYASNLRLASEDPSFILAGASRAAKVYLIGVLSTQGLNNSLWQTDALLSNPSTETVTADLTFTSVGLNGTTTAPLHLTLKPGETQRLANVIDGQWGIKQGGIGVLTVATTSGGAFPIVQGESYDNTDPAKRFGQSMMAVSDANSAGAGQGQYLAGLRQDAKNRTTFWVYNNGTGTAEYDVIYRRLDGTPLGSPVNVRLGAGKLRQFSPGQHPLPAGGLDGGFTVQIVVKSGKVLSAAQVINNLTNDPAYIQGEVR